LIIIITNKGLVLVCLPREEVRLTASCYVTENQLTGTVKPLLPQTCCFLQESD